MTPTPRRACACLLLVLLPALATAAVVPAFGSEPPARPVAEASTDVGAPDGDAAGTAEDESFGARLKRFLNPTRVCPECGGVIREERSLLMLAIGFVGQLVFASRFLVQWIASERRRTSYVPKVFWYLSIVGSLLLLSYAISIRAWPIILGQAFGCLVYGRNLMLIAKAKRILEERGEDAASLLAEGSPSGAPPPAPAANERDDDAQET